MLHQKKIYFKIKFASRSILESIGVVVETTEETWLDTMLEV